MVEVGEFALGCGLDRHVQFVSLDDPLEAGEFCGVLGAQRTGFAA